MAAKKKTAGRGRKSKTATRGRRTSARAGTSVRRRSRKATGIQRTWQDALHRLEGAEKQVETEIRSFIDRRGLSTQEASALWKRWNSRLERESRKTARRLEHGLADLQARARKESHAFGRMIDDAVQGTLAALNIPSRQEVQQLTRKVNQLSRKIDGIRR